MKYSALLFFFLSFLLACKAQEVFFNPDPVEFTPPRTHPLTSKEMKELEEEWQNAYIGKKEDWTLFTRKIKGGEFIPDILLNLDITGMKKHVNKSGYIYFTIPFKSGERKLSSFSKWHISTNCIKARNYMMPTHEMDAFFKYRQDLFFTPHPGDESLTQEEREFIKTLDRCLNRNFAFIYARPYSNMERKLLESGAYSGLLHDHMLLTHLPANTQFFTKDQYRKEVKSLKDREQTCIGESGVLVFFKRKFQMSHKDEKIADSIYSSFGINGVKMFNALCRNFEEFEKGLTPKLRDKFTPEEHKIYMYLGYPLTLKDELDDVLMYSRGTESACLDGQENVLRSTGNQSFFSVETVGNIKKEKWRSSNLVGAHREKAADVLYRRYNERVNASVYCNAFWTKKNLRELILDRAQFDPEGSGMKEKKQTPFQEALLVRYQTASGYCNKLMNYALSKKKTPKSMAHTNLLTKELMKNDEIKRQQKSIK